MKIPNHTSALIVGFESGDTLISRTSRKAPSEIDLPVKRGRLMYADEITRDVQGRIQARVLWCRTLSTATPVGGIARSSKESERASSEDRIMRVVTCAAHGRLTHGLSRIVGKALCPALRAAAAAMPLHHPKRNRRRVLPTRNNPGRESKLRRLRGQAAFVRHLFL